MGSNPEQRILSIAVDMKIVTPASTGAEKLSPFQLVDMVGAAEDEFAVDIDAKAADGFSNIRDIVAFVASRPGAK